MGPTEAPDKTGCNGHFATTHWSLVVRAGARLDGQNIEARREALNIVLLRYLPALRVHLRVRGYCANDVEDLVQKFVAERVIERNLLGRADAARGRFRSFLLTSLENFVANERRAQRAGKRAPTSKSLLALDPERGVDPADPNSGGRGSADSFDVAWAREALAEAMRRMGASCLAAGRMDLWDVFQERVVNPALHNAEPTPYDVLAARCRYTSWKQAANALVTAKRRFEEALRSVLAEHAGDGAAVDQELASLGVALAGARHFEPDESDVGVKET